MALDHDHVEALPLEQELELERELIEQLPDAEIAKNTVLSAVSHELRTPLTSLLGFAVTQPAAILGGVLQVLEGARVGAPHEPREPARPAFAVLSRG